MPAIQRSPPAIHGYDSNLQPVFSPGSDDISNISVEQPNTPEDNLRLTARACVQQSSGRGSRSLTRGIPVTSGKKPHRFERSLEDLTCRRVTRSKQRLNFDIVPNSPASGTSDASLLNLSPKSPSSAELNGRKASGTTTVSTQFDVSVADFSDEDDRSSGTLVPTSTEVSDLDTEFEVSPPVQQIIKFIYDMPDWTPEMEQAAAIRGHRNTLSQAVMVWNEEYKDLIITEIPVDELKATVRIAKEWKDKILQAQMEVVDIPELQDLRNNASEARSGFIKYVNNANREVRTLEDSRVPTPAHESSRNSGHSVSKAKADRVEKYVESTVGEMQALIDQLEEITLDAPETQLEFRSLQDRAKTSYKEVEVVKKNAKELIDHAIECDLGDECNRMEDVYRTLEKKELKLIRMIQDLKDEYGIVGDSKTTDIKYPVFSGEQTEKLDYYSFKEDWDAYVAVKFPSKAEQVRILTKQSLTGMARDACRHMDRVEDIFSYLKESFGNVSALFANRVAEIRRLGACTGSADKKRKWAVEVRSQLTYLKDLSVKHGMYEDLYTHQIVADIQESLPPDIFKKFLEEVRKHPGRAPKKVVFELLLEYMDEVVALFNHSYTYRLDHGVDPDRYYKTKLEVKKTPPPPTKPPPRQKNYTSTVSPSVHPAASSALSVNSGNSGRARVQRNKPNHGVFVSSSYTAPVSKSCHLCTKSHTHVFYCEQYIEADVLDDRIKVVKKLQACFRCLRMDSDIDFKNRAQWEANHAINCQSEWVCSVDECAKRPRNRQYHFTLCRWHVEKNKRIQADFIKKLDHTQLKPGVSFFFNLPTCYTLNPHINSAADMYENSEPGWNVLDDVNDPSIFMLQDHVVNDRKMLLFYDSGCMGSAISDRASVLLNSVCVRPGPTTMNVAGGKTVLLEGGDDQFLLDLVEPKTKATITALRMPHVTTRFPLWHISLAWTEIQKEYNSLMPGGEILPPAPARIGGEEVDIMIGIRYMKYFPVLLCTLPCGLGIHRSLIAAPRGEITVLGGPHPAWRNATDLVGFLGVTSFFTAELRALQAISRNLRHVFPPVEHESVDRDLDLIDPDLLVPDEGSTESYLVHHPPDDYFLESCSSYHCENHQDLDEWIIPPSWDIDGTCYGLRLDSARFEEMERIGTEVPYKCVRCRNCSRCRQGEVLESVSLKEEQEQYLIDQSVSFNPKDGFLSAKLPFISEPKDFLRPNRYTAEKILDSQLRQLAKNEAARLDVLAAHTKLTSGGYVCALSDLPPDEHHWIEGTLDAGYIIPWRVVWKLASLSTPCRMVFDASSKTPGGESLNNILAKGENKLSKIHNMLIRFRSKPGAFSCDVKMAYNQIRLDPSCYRYQKYLWKNDLDPGQPVIIMIVKTLIYGVRSSGNQLFSGFSKVADYSIENFPEHVAGALALKDDGYVDDVIHTDDTQEISNSTAKSLNFVLSTANLTVKAYTFAGSPPAPEVTKDGIHVGLLGLVWDSTKDLLGIDIKEIYFGKAKRGVLPDAVSGDLRTSLRQNFTRRNMLGKVAGIFDPSGLATAVTSRLKLDLHDLCIENLGWDDQIPDSYLEKWLTNLEDIQELKQVRFRRTVIPPDAVSLAINLIISSDASKSIAIASVHARVLRTSGSYSCQLVTAKSKIVRYNTIPRGELRAAVMSASLAHSVKHNLQSQCSEPLYVTDSTIVLHWLNHDERPLETAVRNSVIEIRRLSDVKQWFHIDGTINIADLGTRHASVSDINLNSDWQNGRSWMKLPRDQMPVKTVEEINLSSEEKRLASQETKQSVMFSDLPDLVPRVSERYKYSQYLYNPNKRSWSSSVRILSYVLRFIHACRPSWFPSWFPPPAPVNPVTSVYPFILKDRPHLSDTDLSRGGNYFFIKATQEVLKFSPDKEYKDSFIIKNGIYHFVGRILDSQEISSPEDTMLDLSPLSFVRPIVDRFSPVAYSIMLHCHEMITHHRSATSSLLESRYIAYILRGRDLASEIVKSCRFCIRHRCKLVEVEMGKLHQSRLTIAPVFYCCQVDLFGPYNAICEHQHRSTVKVYGVVFKDPASCAIAIFVMQNYSTSAFLQVYTRFSSRYGHPTELRIDEGSQLLSACRNMEISVVDITDFLKVNYQVGVKFSTCAVASHNAHGMVERSIREVKSLLNKIYKGLRLDIMSFETCLTWIASELNNLPICLGSRVDNLDHTDLITPSRLILGRNNHRALGGYARLSTPSRLIDQMDAVYDVWWKIWRTEKLIDFIPQPSKWKKTNEQLKEGDIVIFLKADSENRLGEPIWRIARVKSVSVSEDGLARTAVLEYRNPNEKTFRTTNRSVRTVVVVHREGDLDVLQSLERAAQSADLDPDVKM